GTTGDRECALIDNAAAVLIDNAAAALRGATTTNSEANDAGGFAASHLENTESRGTAVAFYGQKIGSRPLDGQVFVKQQLAGGQQNGACQARVNIHTIAGDSIGNRLAQTARTTVVEIADRAHFDCPYINCAAEDPRRAALVFGERGSQGIATGVEGR